MPAHKLSLLAALSTALLIPSVSYAAVERWNITSTTMSDTTSVSGHFDYDTTTQTITVSNISLENVAKSYAFYGQHSAGSAIFHANVTATLNASVYRIDLSNLVAPASNTASLDVYAGSCGSLSGTNCASVISDTLSGPVTVTRASATAIPTLTEWAMILMGLMLAGAAALTLQGRRRRA